MEEWLKMVKPRENLLIWSDGDGVNVWQSFVDISTAVNYSTSFGFLPFVKIF